ADYETHTFAGECPRIDLKYRQQAFNRPGSFAHSLYRSAGFPGAIDFGLMPREIKVFKMGLEAEKLELGLLAERMHDLHRDFLTPADSYSGGYSHKLAVNLLLSRMPYALHREYLVMYEAEARDGLSQLLAKSGPIEHDLEEFVKSF